MLSFFDSLNFALFDLLDDDGGTTALGLSSELFTLILCLEGLQALNFHHDVQAFLLGNPLRLQLFVLFELLVSNRNDIGIEYHLVHVLDIIKLFIKLGLGL